MDEESIAIYTRGYNSKPGDRNPYDGYDGVYEEMIWDNGARDKQMGLPNKYLT